MKKSKSTKQAPKENRADDRAAAEKLELVRSVIALRARIDHLCAFIEDQHRIIKDLHGRVAAAEETARISAEGMETERLELQSRADRLARRIKGLGFDCK